MHNVYHYNIYVYIVLVLTILHYDPVDIYIKYKYICEYIIIHKYIYLNKFYIYITL